MRVFLDANILFSSAKSDGAVRALLKLLRQHGHVLVADGFVVEEARRNLARKAGSDGREALDTLLTVVEIGPVTSIDSDAPWLAWLPPKDQPVLASAVSLRCDALITGDRTHFGSRYGRQVEGVMLLSPALAADQLLDSENS
jgi:predicted nucleic acid-binding protein